MCIARLAGDTISRRTIGYAALTIAFAFDPFARAEAWLAAKGFEITPETGLEELRMPIDLAFAASGATGAGHSKESIATILAAAIGAASGTDTGLTRPDTRSYGPRETRRRSAPVTAPRAPKAPRVA